VTNLGGATDNARARTYYRTLHLRNHARWSQSNTLTVHDALVVVFWKPVQSRSCCRKAETNHL
jgi:hypothetical protein